MKLTTLLPASLCVLLLQACAGLQPASDPTFDPPAPLLPYFGNAEQFGSRPEIPSPDDLHRLPPGQQASFLEYFHHPSRAHVAPHWRLYQYLENIVANYEYDPDTRTAAEVLAYKGGNCMSLAILTTALARLADIDISYQLMDDRPVFEYQGDVVIRGVHISSLINDPHWAAVVETSTAIRKAPGLRIDYFPEIRGRFLANIDSSGYLAMYYSNIASSAIAQGELGKAYWYLLEALEYAPDHGASLNMMAVINRRVGDLDTAENIYRYGIAHASDKLGLMKNYRTLLAAHGRHAEARRIQERLDASGDSSPLHWLQLARSSHENQDWADAIRYYRRVLELAPYMHEVHLGLAQSYHAAGEPGRAERELLAAVDLANRVSTRNLYKAKLLSLRKEP